MLKIFFSVSVFLLIVGVAIAQIPHGFYDSADGKTGADLKTALHEIISGHNELSYSQLWEAFEKTDKAPNGSVWEMFSECVFEFVANQCGQGGARNICDCFAREHSFPRSWYGGDVMPMHSDLFHIFPIDAIINSQRGNRPYGEVGEINTIREGGLGRFGAPRVGLGFYASSVFEPDDEYKGDVARAFFYMATRYENILEDWFENESARQMLDGTAFPAFRDWALEMLIRWHENDPVSQKEIDRNNAVFLLQNNRNPFIDNPNFVLSIWRNVPQNTNISQSFPSASRRGNFTLSVKNRKLSIKTNSQNGRHKASIYSPDGRLLKKFDSQSTDLSALAKGIYILRVGRKNFKFALD